MILEARQIKTKQSVGQRDAVCSHSARGLEGLPGASAGLRSFDAVGSKRFVLGQLGAQFDRFCFCLRWLGRTRLGFTRASCPFLNVRSTARRITTAIADFAQGCQLLHDTSSVYTEIASPT